MKNGMMKVGNEIYRKVAVEMGPPVELDYPEDWDDEEEFEPDKDDAYMQPSGQLGSRVSLSVEGKFIDEFSDEDEAKTALVEWTEENNFFPNLWYIDDHGGVNGPLPYGEFLEEAGPGRQEGATYRKGEGPTAPVPGFIQEDIERGIKEVEFDNRIAGTPVVGSGLASFMSSRDPLPKDMLGFLTGYRVFAYAGRGYEYEVEREDGKHVWVSGQDFYKVEEAAPEQMMMQYEGVTRRQALTSQRIRELEIQGFQERNPELTWEEAIQLWEDEERHEKMMERGEPWMGPWNEELQRYGNAASACACSQRTARIPLYQIWWDDNMGRNGAWAIVENDAYGDPPIKILTDDPNLTDDELRQYALPIYDVSGNLRPDDFKILRDAPRQEGGEEEYYEEGPMPGSGVALGPHRNDPYWDRYGAPEDGVMEVGVEGDFPFDVSLLDETVINSLKENQASEQEDFSIFAEEVLVEQVDDLDEVERTINDASVVTTLGGRYSLEVEGDMVNVFFDAEVGEVDTLLDEFYEEEAEDVEAGNIEEYED